MNVFELQLVIQVAFGGGYLAYVVAYSGLMSRHTARDGLAITFAFGTIPALLFSQLAPLLGNPVSGGASLLAAVVAGALWRAKLRAWAYWLLHVLKIHRDDGMADGWTSLIQDPKLNVTQVLVVTKDGQELFCANVGAYAETLKKGLELGSDGSVTMVVETIERNGQAKALRNIVTSDHGARITHIPADQIARIDLRSL